MSKFNVGDRVVGNKLASGRYIITKEGYTGTVTKLVSDGSFWLNNHYRVEPTYFNLDVLRYGKIVITTDGKTTLARLYDGKNVAKSAEAVCCPTDDFNFNIGAQLAFNRLVYGTDYHPSEVALKPEQPKQEDKHTYKAGDKVKVINNTCGHFAKIGSVITLNDNDVQV